MADTNPARIASRSPPYDIEQLRKGLIGFLATEVDFDGRPIRLRSVKWGVYAFYDYDDEPIYVGQTKENIGTRIGRHLTGQRTDAVAKSVLDPLEVKSVRVWPLLAYQHFEKKGDLRPAPEQYRAAVMHLNSLERLVFDRAIADSRFRAILNEEDPPPSTPCEWFEPISGVILSDELLKFRAHPDTRVARRAATIAKLAQVISERELRQGGLRRALLTQARRLEWLACSRYEALGGAGTIEERASNEGEHSEDEIS